MGMAPSADLFYGYDLGNMYDPSNYESTAPGWLVPDDDDGEEQDWESVLAVSLGWVKVPFPENAPARDYSLPREVRAAAHAVFQATPEYQVYAVSRDEKKRILDEVPVEFMTYGYSEEPAYCVRVKESVQTCPDWGSVALEPELVSSMTSRYDSRDWLDRINMFCKLLSLPIPAGGPGWHMNCSYG